MGVGNVAGTTPADAGSRQDAHGSEGSATRLGDLDTPVPLVDTARLESNLGRMAAAVAATPSSHRPHTKSHKTQQIAERQLAHGAQGLTVAKLGEAEALVAAGFDDILVAFPLVGEQKIARLLRLLDDARVRFTVDSEAGARAASERIAAAGHRVEVLLEVEAGSQRSGLPGAAEAVSLAERVDALPGLRVAGVLTFGSGYVDGADAQRAAAEQEGSIAVGAAEALRAAGHEAAHVSAGSTPTSPYLAAFEGVTEVRAGNYVYYDCKQVSMGVATFDDCALTMLATVVSHPRERRYVIDAGLKTMAGEDYGWGTYGRLLEQPDVLVTSAFEEHGIIDVPDGIADPHLAVGDRVRIIPNHACGAANMHDEVVAVDGDVVVERWAVVGRGRVR